MRWLLVLAMGMFLCWGTLPGSAQFAKEKEKDRKDTQIQELGGKTLEQWIKEISSKDRSKGENAIRTVQMFGPDRAFEAVPALIAELKRNTTIEVDVSIRVNATIALGNILDQYNFQKVDEGPDPKIVLDAVTVLKRMLTDTQSIVRYRAAEALGKIGPQSKSAIKMLIVHLRDIKTWEVRQAAAVALGKICLEPKVGPPLEVIQALIRALDDLAFQVRLSSIQSLTWLGGPADEKIKQQMIKAIKVKADKDKEPTVRIWAHMAAMSIMHDYPSEHITPIIAMLEDPELPARVQAAQALATLATPPEGFKKKPGPNKAARAVPQLIKCLNDKEPVVVMNCIMALSIIGKDAARAESVLEKMAKDKKRPELIQQAALHAADVISGRYEAKMKEMQKKQKEMEEKNKAKDKK